MNNEIIRKEEAADIALRQQKLRLAMSQAGAEACLLTMDVNLIYLTGQIFSGYLFFCAEGEPWYFIKRPNGLTGERVRYIRKPEDIPAILSQSGITLPKSLFLEADEISYNDHIRLQAAFHPQSIGNATPILRTVRCRKTPLEIAAFRLSAARHADTYAQVPSCFRPGMTDLDFQYEIEHLMRRNGSIGIFRTFGANMDIFMGSILAGDNAACASPYDFALGGAGGTPTLPLGANGTPLTDGTAVMVDMAGNYTPYLTDMTRVFSIGTLPEAAYHAHQTALHIQQAVIDVARPGTPCADLYHIAVTIAEKEGLADNFMGTRQQAKFVGHGIGLQINELPVLAPRSKEILEPDMLFALEPKFVIPGVGAVGIENSFLVTNSGLEKLTRCNEEIIRL